jgi:predicted RNA-binding protein
MCLATAYWYWENKQPILRDIANARISGDIVELETLLGGKETLQGKIREIDFMDSKIILER